MQGVKSDKKSYMREQEKLLRDFGIPLTAKLRQELDSLYPRKIAIENRIRKLILEKLGK